MNCCKNILGLNKVLNNKDDDKYKYSYPFINYNFAEVLANKQKTLPWSDFYQRYIIVENGLQDTLTKEIQPFCILCDHYSTYLNKNDSRICNTCGLYILKSSIDRDYLNKKCCHPFVFCYYKSDNVAMCYQCKNKIDK
jgi:hypothetical protein